MGAFLRWYLVVQLLGLLTLPLAWRLFRHLPDRGYAASKPLGILLVGGTLWLGTAYGVLRNDAGGAVVPGRDQEPRSRKPERSQADRVVLARHSR